MLSGRCEIIFAKTELTDRQADKSKLHYDVLGCNFQPFIGRGFLGVFFHLSSIHILQLFFLENAVVHTSRHAIKVRMFAAATKRTL